MVQPRFSWGRASDYAIDPKWRKVLREMEDAEEHPENYPQPIIPRLIDGVRRWWNSIVGH